MALEAEIGAGTFYWLVEDKPGPDDSGFSFHSITLSLPAYHNDSVEKLPDGFPGMPECSLVFIIKMHGSSEIVREISRDGGWYMAAQTAAHLNDWAVTPEIVALLQDGI
tara:strand:+ start:1832 stop:2158 length:327 start_codon:yes stop_codon:yes gene_type:complete